MKSIFAMILAAGLAGGLASEARAQDIEMSKLSCGELGRKAEPDITLYIVWLDGLVSAKMGQTTIGADRLKAMVVDTAWECSQNPDKSVAGLIEKRKKR